MFCSSYDLFFNFYKLCSNLMTNGKMFLWKNGEYDVPNSVTPRKTYKRLLIYNTFLFLYSLILKWDYYEFIF